MDQPLAFALAGFLVFTAACFLILRYIAIPSRVALRSSVLGGAGFALLQFLLAFAGFWD
jgi:hypothetical protein